MIAKRTKTDDFLRKKKKNESKISLFLTNFEICCRSTERDIENRREQPCHAFMCGTNFFSSSANILNWYGTKIRENINKINKNEFTERRRNGEMTIKMIHSSNQVGSTKVWYSRQFSELIFFFFVSDLVSSTKTRNNKAERWKEKRQKKWTAYILADAISHATCFRKVYKVVYQVEGSEFENFLFEIYSSKGNFSVFYAKFNWRNLFDGKLNEIKGNSAFTDVTWCYRSHLTCSNYLTYSKICISNWDFRFSSRNTKNSELQV